MALFQDLQKSYQDLPQSINAHSLGLIKFVMILIALGVGIKHLVVVTGTTNWAADVEAAKTLGCARFVEFGPGKVLSGLVKKIDPALAVANVADMASLDATVAALG